MDIHLFSHAIEPLVEKMSLYDPEHAEIFFENGQALKKKMADTDQKIYQQMQNIPSESRYLITSHDAFFYFARRYLAESSECKNQRWKERFAAPEGLAPDGQISPLDIQVIIDYALTHDVKALFPESNLNQDALRKIIEVLNQRGAHVVLSKEPLYGDTLGESGSGAETYLQMMEYNANQISTCLQGKGAGG
jgi:manganese/zinc/iron transport system substrate-binding protein